MDLEIIHEKENLLLDRKEIAFNILHTSATPSREDVKNKLIALLNSQYELVIIDKLTSEYGTQKTIGYAKVYSDAQRANQIENKHTLERNKPKPVAEETKEAIEIPEESIEEIKEEITEETKETIEKLEESIEEIKEEITEETKETIEETEESIEEIKEEITEETKKEITEQ